MARLRLLGILVGLGAAAAACVPPNGGPGEPPAPACSSSAAGYDGPLSVAEADQEIREDVAESGTRELDGSIPVVTTEVEPSGDVTVERATVTDEDEAAAVARAVAAEGDLVAVEVDDLVRTEATNDPYFGHQWAFTNTTFQSAWATTNGAGAVVAVVDTGVQASHPDLSGQIIGGADFVGADYAGWYPYGVQDPHGHGTHVAGTIAARAGNGKGTAGVAPGARILAVRVLGASGAGWSSDVALGITYAADHGADVVNLSLGGSSPSSSVIAAIDHARSKGVVVVAAAGNSGSSGNAPSWPAAYERTIAVAATTSANERAPFSTCGGYVDLAAPGQGIVAPYPPAGYASLSGTSMATPHVAALAAMVKALRPACSPDAVLETMRRGAVDLGAAGWDAFTGHGLVNPAAAVAAPAC